MELEAYRDFQLLTEIASGDSVTQRRLAQKYGLALGLTNFLMRRLVKKGYVKIVNLERKRLRYLLTPNGVAEKARLTYEYLDYSLALYRQTRTFLTQTLSILLQSGRARIVLYGTGELAEIAFLIMQQRGLEVVAVVDESARAGERFMNRLVKALAELPALSFDWVVIASFTDHRKITQQVCDWGVSAQKVVTISDQQRAAMRPGTPAESLEATLEPSGAMLAAPCVR